MKRILITTGIFEPEIGGPASYARTLGVMLAAKGYDVTVLTYSPSRIYRPDANRPFRVVRVWKRIPRFIRHALYGLKAFIYAWRADVILALNAVSAGVPALIAARLAGKPFVVRIVGDYAWEMALQKGKTFLLINEFQAAPKTGHIRRLARLQTWVCSRAKAVIVPSSYLSELVHGWGIETEKIHVIYNGVETDVPVINKEEARRRLNISGNIILSCGRLVPWKGFRMLIKLMPQLLQVNQFFRLVIVGDGPDMKMLRAVVRNLGLERKVYLVGSKSKDDLAVYLAAADIFVLNTGYEGFSHQVLEAMAAGVPVVTTLVGGNREVISQGQNGFMVRYNDEFNLVEAIKTVWRQPELKERLIENARHTVAAFTAQHMYEQTVALLDQVK